EWLDEPDDASEPEFDLGITFSESDDDILDAAVDEHPLYLRAFEYAEAAHQWLRRHGKEWSDAPPDRSDTEQGASEGQCGINLSDALAVVSWYHTLIAAKLNRAVRGVLENEQEHPFGHEPDPDDAFGEDDAAFDIYEAN